MLARAKLRWLQVALTLFVEAYKLAGCSTRSLSLKGCFMLSP